MDVMFRRGDIDSKRLTVNECCRTISGVPWLILHSWCSGLIERETLQRRRCLSVSCTPTSYLCTSLYESTGGRPGTYVLGPCRRNCVNETVCSLKGNPGVPSLGTRKETSVSRLQVLYDTVGDSNFSKSSRLLTVTLIIIDAIIIAFRDGL